MDAAGKKTTEMQEYLLAWEHNWKGLGFIRYAFDLLPCSTLESHRIAATFIFGVLLTPQQENLKLRMRGQVF